MNIIVLATATRTSGALSIYRQFISHLPHYTSGHQFYLFIDPAMDHPKISGVNYIMKETHSWWDRIWWDRKGVKLWMTNNHIIPDVIVSLQNTGIITDCKQVIYYHQSIPFYPKKWNPFKASERIMFLYKYIYPWFVSSTLNKKTDVVVQIPFIKRCFVEKFKIDQARVHVFFPDIKKNNIDQVIPARLDFNLYHFIYPAVAESYKGHCVLVEAIAELKQRDPVLAAKIRIHLTITPNDYPSLYTIICAKKVEGQFVWQGRMEYTTLLSFYKAVQGLLFPSTIETLGLPLIEAASFGLPILVSDACYSHEVIGDYLGGHFLSPDDHKQWSYAIEELCNFPFSYPALQIKESSWPLFFDLIFDHH